jgi:3-dehydroquinate synthetase
VFRSVNKPSVSGYGETLKQLGTYAAFIAGLFAPNCTRGMIYAMTHSDILILGGGIVGLATGYSLSQNIRGNPSRF